MTKLKPTRPEMRVLTVIAVVVAVVAIVTVVMDMFTGHTSYPEYFSTIGMTLVSVIVAVALTVLVLDLAIGWMTSKQVSLSKLLYRGGKHKHGRSAMVMIGIFLSCYLVVAGVLRLGVNVHSVMTGDRSSYLTLDEGWGTPVQLAGSVSHLPMGGWLLLLLTAAIIGGLLWLAQAGDRIKTPWSSKEKDEYEKAPEDAFPVREKQVKSLRSKTATEQGERQVIADVCVTHPTTGKKGKSELLRAPKQRNTITYGAPGTSKGVSRVFTQLCDKDGVVPPPGIGDGWGLGWAGPQIVISSSEDIARATLPWRMNVARAAVQLAQHNKTGDIPSPSEAEVRDLVQIVDLHGMLRDPEYDQYKRGIDFMTAVHDFSSAQVVAKRVLGEAPAEMGGTHEFFKNSASSVLGTLLLAAHRADNQPLIEVYRWSKTLSYPSLQAKELKEQLLLALSSPATGEDDRDAYTDLNDAIARTAAADGERSGLWGTLQQQLSPAQSVEISRWSGPNANHSMLDMDAMLLPYATTFIILPGSHDDRVTTGTTYPALVQWIIHHARLTAQTQTTGRHQGLKHPCLLIVDEMKDLGKVAGLENGTNDLRKTGMQLSLITQTPAQIEKLYGSEGRASIEAGCGVITVMPQGQPAAYLRELAAAFGSRTAEVHTRSKKDREKGDKQAGSGKQIMRLELEWTKLDQLPAGQQVVLAAGLAPIIATGHPAVQDRNNAAAPYDPVMQARIELGTAAGIPNTRVNRGIIDPTSRSARTRLATKRILRRGKTQPA